MTTEGEERLLHAICLMVERYTIKNMPEAHQGVHAPVFDRVTIRQNILDALNRIVTDLTEKAMAEIRAKASTLPPKVDREEPL